MLVAEQLFLLLRRDDGRAVSGSGYEGYGLIGAVLTDLLVAGHITLDSGKDARVSVAVSGLVGHPVLDAPLARLRDKDGATLSSIVRTRLSARRSARRSSSCRRR